MMAREPETLEEFIKRTGDAPILVSACLLGLQTRYDGGARACDAVLELARTRQLIPICPEQLGGLPTPRVRQALSEGQAKVVNDAGRDVTGNFLRGARETLSVAKTLGARFAILKDKSPSCGAVRVYVDGELVDGCGVTAAALKMLGVGICCVE
jgi:uncharacterized protein YbbK (DUF523 family)